MTEKISCDNSEMFTHKHVGMSTMYYVCPEYNSIFASEVKVQFDPC